MHENWKIPKRLLALFLALALSIPAPAIRAAEVETGEQELQTETTELSEIPTYEELFGEDAENSSDVEEEESSEAVSDSEDVSQTQDETDSEEETEVNPETQEETSKEEDSSIVPEVEEEEKPDESLPLGASGENVSTGETTITAEALNLPMIREKDSVDLLEGVTAISKQEEDVTASVVVSDNGGFDSFVPGDYTVTYQAKDGDTVTGTLERKVTVHPYIVQTEDLEVAYVDEEMQELMLSDSEKEDVNFDVDLTEYIYIFDQEETIVEDAEIVVIDDNGFVDATVLGDYTVRYAMKDGGKTLFEFERVVSVKQPLRMSTFASVPVRISDSGEGLSIEAWNNGVYRVTNINQNYLAYPYQFYKGSVYMSGGEDTGGTAVGTAFKVDGVIYNDSYLSHGSSMTGTGTYGTLGVAQISKVDDRTIRWTWTVNHKVAGQNRGQIVFHQYANLPVGSRQLHLSWSVENKTNFPINTSIVHGGDTYFAGNDRGYAAWNSVNRTISIVPSSRDPKVGRYSYMSDSSTPSTKFGAESWSTNKTKARDFRLQDILDRSDHDCSVYHQWDNISIPAYGTSKTIKATMSWSVPGAVKLEAPAPRVAPNYVYLGYDFTITNDDVYAQDVVAMKATSSNKWTVTIDTPCPFQLGGYNSAPQNSATILVNLHVPLEATAGMVDTLTLEVKVRDHNGNEKWLKATTETKIDIEMEAIQEIYVIDQTPTDITIGVTFRNVDLGFNRNTVMKILDENYNEIDSRFYEQEKAIPSGGQFVFDISNLQPETQYFVWSRAEGIPYPATAGFIIEDLVTLIDIDPDEIDMTVGESFHGFHVDVRPDSARDKTLSWSSADSTIATVTQAGEVVAKKAGTTTITAKSNSNPNVTKDITVHVYEKVSSMNVTPSSVLLKKNETVVAESTVAPSNVLDKSVTWVSNSTSVATVTPSVTGTDVSPQKATIKGVRDGSTKVFVTSNGNSSVRKEIIVNVDGTVPKFTAFTLTPTANPWTFATIPTNKEMKVTINTTDPTTNGYASGVDKIFYQVVKGTGTPSFNPNNTSGWTAVTGPNTTFNLNKNTAGTDGSYTVYAVVKDKAGNYSAVTASDSLAVDTEPPVIELPGGTEGNGSDIHVLVGGTVNLKNGVHVTDNGVDVSNQVQIDQSQLNLNLPGKYIVKYSYTDAASNTTTTNRNVYVHGKPAINVKNSLNISVAEGTLSLLNTPDSRLNFSVPKIKSFNANGVESMVDPDVTVTGLKVTNGKLDLVGAANNSFPKTVTVTYKATYTNPVLGATSPVTVTKNANIVIYANGTLPGGPEVEIPPGGIVTPPGGGGGGGTDPEGPGSTVDPLDPTGVTRIEYFQNNGVKKANGSTQPNLTVSDIENAVRVTGADSKTITIRNGGIGTASVPLTESSLATALQSVGQKKIVYTFTNEIGMTTYTVMLRVNSDMTATQTPVLNVFVGDPVNVQTNAPKASFQAYTTRTEQLTITNPSATSNTVKQETLKYRANYPFAMKEISRIFRVHGRPTFTAQSPVNVNETENSIKLLAEADGRIKLNVPDVKHVKNDGTIATVRPTVKVEGVGVTLSNNTLDFSTVSGSANPRKATVKYTVSYQTEWQTAPTVETKEIVIAIYKNGTLPGGPEIEIPGGGETIVIPPGGGGGGEGTDPEGPGSTVDPMDPTGVTRIEYFQNNGVKRKNGTTQPNLTVRDIENAVTSSNATSKTITIRNGGIGTASVPLTDSSLATALQSVGQKKIVYTFTNDEGFVTYTVMLRVNSDMSATATAPIDTLIGETVNVAAGAPTASYKAYDGETKTLTITNPTATATEVKQTTLKYRANYPFSVKEIARVSRVHGKPSLSAQSPVNVTETENSMKLLNDADIRIKLTSQDAKYIAADGSTKTAPSTIKVTGTGVTDNVLTFTEIKGTTNPRNAKVTYTISYPNPTTGNVVAVTKDIVIAIYDNGTLPGGPEIEIPGGGETIVTPPGGGGGGEGTDPEGPGSTVDPMDPTGVTRIEYFQNNGVKRKNGTTQPNLTVRDIENAVTSSNATSKTITIRNGGIGTASVPLTDSSLATALQSVGQKKIVYTFTNSEGSATYTVMLRVNSDMTATSTGTIDTIVGTVIDANQGAPTASYKAYDGETKQLTITNPAITTTVVEAKNVTYTADYPFAAKSILRLVRVHGKVTITGNGQNIDIRVNEVPTGGLKKGMTAKVSYAPLTAGGAVITKDLLDDVVITGNTTGLSTVGRETLTYSATFQLPSEYGVALTLPQAEPVSRQVTTHSLVSLTANTLTVGPGYTASQFKPLQDAIINAAASVTYYGGDAVNLKNKIEVTSNINDIKFGVPGTYKLTFKVSDQSVGARPAGLPAMTETITVQVIVSGENVGQKPTISGTSDKNILQNDTITEASLLAGVTAQDHKQNGNASIVVSVANASGAPVAIGTISKTIGVYTVTYTATDSLGDISTTTSKIYVYGPMKIVGDNFVQNYRVDHKLPFEPDYTQIYGTYESPTEGTVTVKQSEQSDLFAFDASVIDFSQRGNYYPTVTIKHPVFKTVSSASITGRVNVKVHEQINLTASTEINATNGTTPATGTVLNLRDGATATYRNADGVMVTLPNSSIRITSNGYPAPNDRLTIQIATLSYTIAYTVADDLIPQEPDTSASFVLEGTAQPPTLVFRLTTAKVRVAQRPTAQKIPSYFPVLKAYATGANGRIVQLRGQVQFDTSQVNFTQAGTYPITASLTYADVTTTCDLTLIIQ